MTDRNQSGSSSPRTLGGGAAIRFLERRRALRALLIGTAAALITLILWDLGALERLELASYDARVRAAAPGGRSDLIEMVAWDDPSVLSYEELLGLSFAKWPRTVHADLLKFIARGKPKLIVVDLLFAGGDGQAAENHDLVEACREAGNVILACNFGPGREGIKSVPPGEIGERFALGPADGGFATLRVATFPLPELARVSRGLGSIHLETDRDDVARAVSPAVNYCGHLYPTLSTAAASAHLGSRPIFEGGSFRLGAHHYRLDARGRRQLFWYGRNAGPAAKRYRSTAAGWLLDSVREGKNPDAPAELFRDKIVLIGATFAAGHDFRKTPMGLEPGMHIHAAAIENLVRGEGVYRLGAGWTLLAVLVLALCVALAFPGRGWQVALRGTGAYLLLGGGYLALSVVLYSRAQVWTGLVAPQLGAAMAFSGSLLAGYLVEGRQVRRFRRALSRFLSPEVLAEVSRNLDDLRPGVGRRCQVSMMFCDVRGFTPMSERLEPETVVEILDIYLGAMTEVIMANGGTLSKYLGDGIMAFWGAPQEVPDHAARAARAALDMVRAQEEVKVRLAAEGMPTFDIGIGLHSGPAVVGTVGSEERLEYTAIGDTVNLASRVEQLTKEFRVRIVVTADFARDIRDRFEFRELGAVKVKGRSADVRVYELEKAVSEE